MIQILLKFVPNGPIDDKSTLVQVMTTKCLAVSCKFTPWRHHQIKTFSILLALCKGTLPVTSGFSSQRPVTRSFDVFFHLRLNIRLTKQPRRRWFGMPSRPLWRHCNDGEVYTVCLFITKLLEAATTTVFNSSTDDDTVRLTFLCILTRPIFVPHTSIWYQRSWSRCFLDHSFFQYRATPLQWIFNNHCSLYACSRSPVATFTNMH